MSTNTKLPGIDAARDTLGLSLEEVADAVRANPSTLYRWRSGDATPNDASIERLRRLEELSDEVRRSLAPAQTALWLNAAASVFGGRSPREMICQGRAETVLGALLSHRQLFRALRSAEGGRSSFADLMDREDLSLSTKAALALIDRRIEELVAELQTEDSSRAGAEAFETQPSVKIRGRRPPGGVAQRS